MHLLLVLLTREPGALTRPSTIEFLGCPSELQIAFAHRDEPADEPQGDEPHGDEGVWLETGTFLDRLNHAEGAGSLPVDTLCTRADSLGQLSGVVLDGPWIRAFHGVPASDIVVYVDGTRMLDGLGSSLFP